MPRLVALEEVLSSRNKCLGESPVLDICGSSLLRTENQGSISLGGCFRLRLHYKLFLLDQTLNSVMADVCGVDLSVCLLVSFTCQSLES